MTQQSAFADVTEHLEREGLAKFEKSWGELGATIATELEPPARSRQKIPSGHEESL